MRAGLAQRAEVQVSYAIGRAKPMSVKVDTFGTGDAARAPIHVLVAGHDVEDTVVRLKSKSLCDAPRHHHHCRCIRRKLREAGVVDQALRVCKITIPAAYDRQHFGDGSGFVLGRLRPGNRKHGGQPFGGWGR